MAHRSFSYRSRRWGGPTKVTVHWSNKYNAYAINWQDTNHWNEMQPFISFLKSIPYGERDYDADNRIWYLAEQHLDKFMAMLDLMPSSIFEKDFQKKPDNQTNFHTFVSVDTYLDKFKELTGFDVRGQDYNDAKKIYRRSALANHPDRNGGDGSKMSDINEAWSHIESLHFKIKKEPEYAQT